MEEYVVDLCMHTDSTLGGVKGVQETSQENVKVLSVEQNILEQFFCRRPSNFASTVRKDWQPAVLVTLREMQITREEVS